MSEFIEVIGKGIPKGWRIQKIDDLKSKEKYSISMGPFGSNIKAENFVKSGVPIIKGTNLNFFRFVGGDFTYLTDQKANELKSSNCKSLDLIFTHRGTIGQVGIVPEGKFERYVVSQSGMKLTLDNSLADPFFLLYFFKSTLGQNQLLLNEAQVGVPSISSPLQSLKSVEVLLPPLPEQKSIAEVLSSLDDKIDLLHRNNKTLEELAETLFRQWFVEEADDSWEVDILDNLFEIGIGRTPPRKEQQWFSTDSKDVKWVSIKDMGSEGVYLDTTSEYLTEDAIMKFHIPVIPPNTVILSFKMTIGRLAITTERMLSNEAIAHFKLKPNTNLFPEFLYLYLKTYRWEQLGSTSSIVESINSQMIKEMVLIIPSSDKLKMFKLVIKPYFEKIRNNQSQLKILETLRDTLLPKLMSGTVKVKK